MRKQFTYHGKRYSVMAKTAKELDKKIAIKKRDIDNANDPTLSDWIDKYLATYKTGVSDKTLYDYELVLNHLRSTIRISEVRQIDMQKLFNSHKDKSKSFLRKLKLLSNEVFQTAMYNGLIDRNPMIGVKVPRGYEHKRRSLTEQERQNVIELSLTDYYGRYALLMLQCGLRPSETTYIQGKDIDKENRLLHVRGTKTAAADRYVPIPDPLFSMIMGYTGDEYVALEKPNRNSLNMYWKYFKQHYEKRYGPCTFTAYCFRHTYATDLCAAGVPLSEARFLLGHSTIAMTAEIYTHQSHTALNNAANLIDSYNQNLTEK